MKNFGSITPSSTGGILFRLSIWQTSQMSVKTARRKQGFRARMTWLRSTWSPDRRGWGRGSSSIEETSLKWISMFLRRKVTFHTWCDTIPKPGKWGKVVLKIHAYSHYWNSQKGFDKDIVQLEGKYFIYVLVKKNFCLDSKFENTDLLKKNSDSFRNRWETLKCSSSLYQKVNLWYMKWILFYNCY